MATDQEAIETFMSITGVDEATAIQKLEEHRGSLNEAVNAHFGEGDRNLAQPASLTSLQDEAMDIDDPLPFESHRPLLSSLSFARDLNPFSLLDPNFTRSIFARGDASNQSPFVSHPREVREIPIEVKDDTGSTGHSIGAPIIEDVTEAAHEHGPEQRGTVIIDDEDDDDRSFLNSQSTRDIGYNSINSEPSAPAMVDEPDYGNDIEEEMIRAAIEASKQEAGMSNQEGKFRPSGVGQISGASDEMEMLSSNGRRQSEVEVGSTNLPEEVDDVEELPLVRRRRRRVSPIDIDDNNEDTPPSSPPPEHNAVRPQQFGSDFPSEWGGISSEEHDEAVMLEAAMFGGVPEGVGRNFPYTPSHLMQNGLGTSVGPYPTNIPRPPSPSLTAQRLIREQQDDEFLAALQADQEKEMKAKEAAEAALAEERLREEAMQRKLQEEKENERQLAAKEASLPREPTPDDEKAVTLLVRMPDGSRRGRRFLKSDKLKSLFDFIDVGRAVKPGSYRLVRPYPRRAFGDGESSSSLEELGLTSKQEALYLELI